MRQMGTTIGSTKSETTEQGDSYEHWLHTAIATVSLLAVVASSKAQVQETVFDLVPEKKALNCLSANDGYDPTAQVIVQRGGLNDVLILHAKHLKPNTGFDLFTVQHSNLLADGAPDPNFKNFGLAWYQIVEQPRASDDWSPSLDSLVPESKIRSSFWGELRMMRY